jgi:hypothetical protein
MAFVWVDQPEAFTSFSIPDGWLIVFCLCILNGWLKSCQPEFSLLLA